MVVRLYRRLVIRHFGSTKNFVIWVAAVIATIYVIDAYVLTRDRLQSIVTGGQNDVKKMEAETEKTGENNKKNVVEEPKQEDPKSGHKDNDGLVDRDKSAEKKPDRKDEPPPAPAASGKCGLKTECPPGKFAFYIKSGEGRDTSPTICFNGNYAMSPEKANGKRGLNMVVINENTHEVDDVRTFDTYVEEAILVRYLKLGTKGSNMIIVASQDEASFNLKEDGKTWLGNYGSTLIDKLKFRDGFVMIGQRGLYPGSANEKYEARGNKEFANPIELSGCVGFPMGKLSPIEVPEEEKKADAEANDKKEGGEELPNCGIKESCGPDSFAVHLYTGRENKEGPKICVGGKYVLAKGLNDGGRGFNIVIVDPKTKDVIRVGHFDTYAEDSSNLEIFMEMMNDKEIILATTHDDASKNLNVHAQKIFASLGSSMLEKMSFRDVWAFAGQKGMTGHSTIEEIEFAGPGGWPRPIDKKICVPTELKGSKIKPDPLANKNEMRRKFCSKYDGYGNFCETEHIDEQLVPAPLADKSLENHPIFSIPIIIIPGLNHNAVRMQLETLLMNPGIQPDMVTVMYDEKFDEPASLAKLFNFKVAKLSSSTKYVFQFQKSLEKVWEIYPEARHVMVLEEEVILGPDFLYFMAQCLTAIDSDDSLIGVSAFNDNGYAGLSTDANIAYRTDTFPGLGFLLKKEYYDAHMKNNMAGCCLKRSWEGWHSDESKGFEMIIPDKSRVYRRPYEGLSEQADFLKELFNRERVTNLEPSPKISNADSLTKYKYEEEINQLLKASTPLDTANVADCLEGKGLGFYISESGGKTYAVYLEQENAQDFHVLSLLCKCFKLFNVQGYHPRGLHNSMLRFTYKGNAMFFVGSSSPYYKFMPSSYQPVRRSRSAGLS